MDSPASQSEKAVHKQNKLNEKHSGKWTLALHQKSEITGSTSLMYGMKQYHAIIQLVAY